MRKHVILVACMLAHGSALAVARFVPGDFATIQEAIDASSAGDVVTVAPGTYTENITLKSGVDVRGREAARTFLAPDDTGDPVVLATSVDDVLFGNFTIIDADVGIDVLDSTNLRVVNIIVDTATGVGARIDVDSQADILNGVFYENAVAISRATIDAQITNSAFVGNIVTITSPTGLIVDPNTNVDNSGFFGNDDLVISGVDTGLGTDSVVGDPRFVDALERDFHLREASPFIDTGVGNDSIDNTTADIGAYGGQFADPFPFPLPAPDVSDASMAGPPPFNATINWQENPGYLVTSTTNPGSYRVYYRQNTGGPPYDGTDAGNGTQPSPAEAGTGTSLTLSDLQPVAPAPDAPQLLSAAPFNTSVALSWSAVADATAYRVHWGLASSDENSVDVGAVTSHTITGLTNGDSYVFAVSALRQAIYYFSVTALDSTQNRHESDFSPESTLAIGPFAESVQSNQLNASPAVTIPYPDLPDKGCFVATAAWGVDWAAEVQILRDFRDRYLAPNRFGRAIVDWYYRNGPVAARWIEKRDSARAMTRLLLYPVVVAALVANESPHGSIVIAALLCAMGFVRRRRVS